MWFARRKTGVYLGHEDVEFRGTSYVIVVKSTTLSIFKANQMNVDDYKCDQEKKKNR